MIPSPVSRRLVERVSFVETYPSLAAGAFAIAVFAGSLLLLGRYTSIDMGTLVLPFGVGFLVFMLFYFVVMLFAEPFLRE